jgi:hypothetical protein
MEIIVRGQGKSIDCPEEGAVPPGMANAFGEEMQAIQQGQGTE